MNPRDIRVLTECDTMLAQISQRYPIALARLHEASPGFPAHTPGAGEPGGGKGFTAGSITERLAEHRHPELDALERIIDGPLDVVISVQPFARALNLPAAYTNERHVHVARLAWSRWVIRRLIDSDLEPASKPLHTLHRAIVNLHRTVTAWAYTAKKPAKQVDPTELAEDPTGELCRSCLRIGAKRPRFRTELCRWCYEFTRTEPFLPPVELLEIRSHRPVYDRDVEPHRKAHRDRNKKKRRKAG